MVSNGYLWGDDGQALRCFDGWYTVGDQGYLSDGTLHMLGRRSDMIITAGTNVYPHEVEMALASVPGVAAAVAAGMLDDLRGQRVVAGVVPSHGAVTATQLQVRDRGCAGAEQAPPGVLRADRAAPDGPRQNQPAAAAGLGGPERSQDPASWLSRARAAGRQHPGSRLRATSFPGGLSRAVFPGAAA